MKETGQMGLQDTSEAFLRAFETADCETLNAQIRDWFERPYRTPENSIDVAALMHSAMTAAFTKREEECKTKWRDNEAERWQQARQRFDTGMRAFLEAVALAPKPEAYRGEVAESGVADELTPVVTKAWARSGWVSGAELQSRGTQSNRGGMQAASNKRPRGRPLGSKNKPKNPWQGSAHA